jgi:hypothetical protein
VVPGIISGRAWLQERQRVLQEELAKDPAPEQRAALQTELDAVDQELGAAKSRWWRALLWGTRPPT